MSISRLPKFLYRNSISKSQTFHACIKHLGFSRWNESVAFCALRKCKGISELEQENPLKFFFPSFIPFFGVGPVLVHQYQSPFKIQTLIQSYQTNHFVSKQHACTIRIRSWILTYSNTSSGFIPQKWKNILLIFFWRTYFRCFVAYSESILVQTHIYSL